MKLRKRNLDNYKVVFIKKIAIWDYYTIGREMEIQASGELEAGEKAMELLRKNISFLAAEFYKEDKNYSGENKPLWKFFGLYIKENIRFNLTLYKSGEWDKSKNNIEDIIFEERKNYKVEFYGEDETYQYFPDSKELYLYANTLNEALKKSKEKLAKELSLLIAYIYERKTKNSKYNISDGELVRKIVKEDLSFDITWYCDYESGVARNIYKNLKFNKTNEMKLVSVLRKVDNYFQELESRKMGKVKNILDEGGSGLCTVYFDDDNFWGRPVNSCLMDIEMKEELEKVLSEVNEKIIKFWTDGKGKLIRFFPYS